jgi:hypothetical protein
MDRDSERNEELVHRASRLLGPKMVKLEEAKEELEDLREKLRRIRDWCDAYPLKVFPEPNLRRAAMVLQDHGMTLDSISASNMRHVLDGVRKIIDGETD